MFVLKINNLENIISILDSIPNIKRVNKNKYFHAPSYTTIKINTSEKALAKYSNAICQITTDYGIAGTPVNTVTILLGLDADAFTNYIIHIIADSWWNQ